jgi:hypothetical protein
MAYANFSGSRRPKPKASAQKRGAVVGRDRLSWRRTGNALGLYYGTSKKPLLHVEPDAIWRGIFRIRSGSEISDMVNLTRAKDAALAIALRHLNSEVQETTSDGTHIRPQCPGRGMPPSDPRRIPARFNGLTLGEPQ